MSNVRVLRSAVEAVSCLLEQVLPGDFVRVLGAEQGYGRVLDPEAPQAAGRVLTAGRVLVQRGEEDEIEEFDETDLEKLSAAEIPPEMTAKLAGPEEESLEAQFLSSLSSDVTEEFGIEPLRKRKQRQATRDDRPVDPMRSMAAKVSQRDPLTKQKKRIAMRRNWRRAKGRSAGQGRLGNEPLALRPFESMVEQAIAHEPIEDKAPLTTGAETRYAGPVSPEEARVQTERVYNALSDVMKALALAEGSSYFHSVQDDPDRGVLRLKLNGQAPKDVVERFTAGIEDLEVETLEEPEGATEDRDLRGWWIFEARIPEFEELLGEETEPGEPMVPTTQGSEPGEVRIPIGDEG